MVKMHYFFKIFFFTTRGQFHEADSRLRYIVRKDFLVYSLSVSRKVSYMYLKICISSFVTLRQVNRCCKFKLNMAAVFILMCRRQLRRERQFRDRKHPLDYMAKLEIVSKFRLPRHLLMELKCKIMDKYCSAKCERTPLFFSKYNHVIKCANM